MKAALYLLIVPFSLILISAKAQEGPDSVILPKLIDDDFYTQKQVCDDTRSKGKRFALVLMKTHYCDWGTSVCLDSLRTISDKANPFVQENFATYHTRVFANRTLTDANHDSLLYQDTFNSISKKLVKYWGKVDKSSAQEKRLDVDPEIYILDTDNNECKLLGRYYLNNHNAIHNGFRNNLKGIKAIIRKIFNDNCLDPDSLLQNFSPEEEIRLRYTHPQRSTKYVHKLLTEQTKAAQFDDVSSELYEKNSDVELSKLRSELSTLIDSSSSTLGLASHCSSSHCAQVKNDSAIPDSSRDVVKEAKYFIAVPGYSKITIHLPNKFIWVDDIAYKVSSKDGYYQYGVFNKPLLVFPKKIVNNNSFNKLDFHLSIPHIMLPQGQMADRLEFSIEELNYSFDLVP